VDQVKLCDKSHHYVMKQWWQNNLTHGATAEHLSAAIPNTSTDLSTNE